jgi:hypothetical protein
MRHLSVLTLFAALSVLFLTVSSFADSSGGKDKHDMTPITGSKELEKLKTLSGTWVGTTEMDGKEMPISVVYQTSSNGSVVVETLSPDTPNEMVSVYYDDDGKLSMTHYCAVGNQPHFTLADSSDDQIELVFENGTNMNPAEDGYMHDVTFDFNDDGTMVQEWTYYENGEKADTASFTFKHAQ